MKPRVFRALELVLRLAFGALLVAAAVGKITQPLAFAEAVDNYRVFGEIPSRWAAVFMPSFEMLVGLCLILGAWKDAAVPLNALLMCAFLVLVLQAFFRNLDIHCGCFTPKGESKIDALKIAENVLFAAGGIALWILSAKSSRPVSKHAARK
jgi:putative oxidoreductase